MEHNLAVYYKKLENYEKYNLNDNEKALYRL